jgi:hypothetical protein
MREAFAFPPFDLSETQRAALESSLQALDDSFSARSKSDTEGTASKKRRDALAGEISELENADEAHAAEAAARLPGLREQLAILSRFANRPVDDVGKIREALGDLSAEVADILKEWFGEIEKRWFDDVQRLFHGQPCTQPSVRLGQFPGYHALVQCLMVQPRNWLRVVDQNLPTQADLVSGIARAILEGRNPYAGVHTSPRPTS